MRSQTLHDQRHVVVDQQHAGAVLVAHASARRRRTSGTSGLRAGRRPARPSARSAARSRARVRRRAAARRRARAPPPARPRSAVETERGRAARRPGACASRGAGADAERRDLDVLAHGERRGTRGCAGTCARARAGRGGARGQRVTSRLAELDRAVVGRSKPLSTLTSVDLPAPFGPIRPTTSPRCSSSVTSAERLHALERPGDGGGPERSSGPPRRPAFEPSAKPPRSSGRPSP